MTEILTTGGRCRSARRAPAAATAWRAIAPLLPVLMALLALLATGLASTARAQGAVFKTEELDQMLAPIALYPDSLLSQILMASTYPADVRDAAAWSKARPDLKGDAALAQVESQPWEPSVQSLVAFPQVLAMMSARPDDVQRLGDAFLDDPGRVMDRVQALRAKAQEAGNLKTTEQQKVSAQTQGSTQVIVIEPAQPQTVYVPVYQPTVVYGPWWYPSYPPYYWAPPRYYYPPGAAFVGGVLWGAAIVGVSNSLWGGWNWGRNEVNINVNRYNNVNVNRKLDVNKSNTFVHNADRRRDVPYRGDKSREQFGKKPLEGAGDRQAYRGKDTRDVQRDLQRDKAAAALKDRGADPAAGRDKLQGRDRDKATAAVAAADRGGLPDRADRGGAADRPDRGGIPERPDRGTMEERPDRGPALASPATRDNPVAKRPSRDDAFSGARDPVNTRADANRGRTSRESMASRPTRTASPGAGMSRPSPAARAPSARPAPRGTAGGATRKR
jgi:hypothetical protein